jgi:hypothetical protein
MRHARTNTFCNQVPFELGHGTYHVEQQLARGSGGIDSLRVADEVDAQGTKFL